MKTKIKFSDIAGMLERDEMKEIIGGCGNSYGSIIVNSNPLGGGGGGFGFNFEDLFRAQQQQQQHHRRGGSGGYQYRQHHQQRQGRGGGGSDDFFKFDL